MDPVTVTAVVGGVALVSSGGPTGGTPDVPDAKRRMLFLDLYHGDQRDTSLDKWRQVASTIDLYGAIIKATDGIGTPGGSWFVDNFPRVKYAGGERYGVTWFRGAYHFLRPTVDGARQADHYLDVVEQAGGWGAGDIRPIVDIERGKQGGSNYAASAQQWIDVGSAFSDRIVRRSGQNPILYGRGCMRDLKIVHKFGCDAVWNPCWTRTMVMNGLEAWTLDDVVLWQYCGDGTAMLPGYPTGVQGFGPEDMSVYVDGPRPPTLASFRTRVLRRT